jgi:CMP-N-acetylneuraminic acid synthetase
MENAKKRRLAVLPARSGSKRIPNKNVRSFLGKPIIHYTIEYAQKSELFDRIHASTDSHEIADVVSQCGVDIDFFRPAQLADDHTTLFAVLKYVFNEYQRRGEIFDEIWLLMPCAPMIMSTDLMKAAEIFDNQTPLIAVTAMPCPPQWSYIKNESGLLTFLEPAHYQKRSQDFAQSYFDAGAFAVFGASHMSQKTFDGNFVMPYELPRNRAIDIDTLEDWDIAEKLYRSFGI